MIDKAAEVKPNFSALARKYGVSRNTVRKYWRNGGIPARKVPERKSMLDPYHDEIIALMSLENVTKKAVFMHLMHEHEGEINWNYNTFKWYTLKHNITLRKGVTPHVSYETDPGEQLQADWKENIRLKLKSGEELVFNVFSATLGWSRFHVFIYSRSKTTEDFIRCVIETYRRLGGVTRTLLTDNMSAVVSVRGKRKKVYPEISQLFKDLGVRLVLAKARTPQTKGKDENANKFVRWIYAYDGQLESESDVIRVIEKTITDDANRQINTGTGMPPASLFAQEKETLGPLPNGIMLDSYNVLHKTQTVGSTMDIYFRGSRYSVPPKCIGRRVDIYLIGNLVYIYLGHTLMAAHELSDRKRNYRSEDYREAYRIASGRKDGEIDRRAAENLRKLEGIGKRESSENASESKNHGRKEHKAENGDIIQQTAQQS